MIYATMDLPAISSDVRITASYETADRGSLRVLQKTAQLPLKMMLRACPPENTSTFTTTIKCSEPLVAFSQLFPGKSIGTVVYNAPYPFRLSRDQGCNRDKTIPSNPPLTNFSVVSHNKIMTNFARVPPIRFI